MYGLGVYMARVSARGQRVHPAGGVVEGAACHVGDRHSFEKAVTDVLYPGTIHGFLEAVSIADVAGRAFDDAARWMHALAAR